jgi:hypothetical protein
MLIVSVGYIKVMYISKSLCCILKVHYFVELSVKCNTHIANVNPWNRTRSCRLVSCHNKLHFISAVSCAKLQTDKHTRLSSLVSCWYFMVIPFLCTFCFAKGKCYSWNLWVINPNSHFAKDYYELLLWSVWCFQALTTSLPLNLTLRI